jgi:hypothetical protein
VGPGRADLLGASHRGRARRLASAGAIRTERSGPRTRDRQQRRTKAANQRQRPAPIACSDYAAAWGAPVLAGPAGSPQLPFPAALAVRGLGMSIGALIKGEAALPSEVSLQCGRRSRMRWCNVWARPPGRRSREWRPTFRGGSCYRARRLPMTAMPESGVNPDAAGTTRSGQ